MVRCPFINVRVAPHIIDYFLVFCYARIQPPVILLCVKSDNIRLSAFVFGNGGKNKRHFCGFVFARRY